MAAIPFRAHHDPAGRASPLMSPREERYAARGVLGRAAVARMIVSGDLSA
jgi:hypothetical protein